jgi:uncharacterized protein (DUF302 family)
VIVTQSGSDYATTVARLIAAIEQRGLTVFARVDHAAGARAAGLELADEEVIAFGNPRAGTALMQADPRIGVELPLRILVWAGADGVELGYDDPRDLAGRYRVEEHMQTLDQMAVLLAELAAEATG